VGISFLGLFESEESALDSNFAAPQGVTSVENTVDRASLYRGYPHLYPRKSRFLSYFRELARSFV
jgi:hypothetical protein